MRSSEGLSSGRGRDPTEEESCVGADAFFESLESHHSVAYHCREVREAALKGLIDSCFAAPSAPSVWWLVFTTPDVVVRPFPWFFELP
jgi:hypothetical protein